MPPGLVFFCDISLTMYPWPHVLSYFREYVFAALSGLPGPHGQVWRYSDVPPSVRKKSLPPGCFLECFLGSKIWKFSMFKFNSVFIGYFGFSMYTIILSVNSHNELLNSYSFCFSWLITLGRFSNAMLTRVALFEDFNIPFSISDRKSRQNIGNKCDLFNIYGTLDSKCRIHYFQVVLEYLSK